jgi:hypothetical protein
VPGGIYKLIVTLEGWLPHSLRNGIVVRLARRAGRAGAAEKK